MILETFACQPHLSNVLKENFIFNDFLLYSDVANEITEIIQLFVQWAKIPL
jgi:hypothetical protein